MTPTNKLRFVERQIKLPDFFVNPNTMKPVHQTIKILQQWWEKPVSTMNLGWTGDIPLSTSKPTGEWRDVPIEKEEA